MRALIRFSAFWMLMSGQVGLADVDKKMCGNAPTNPILDAMDCSIDPCVDFYQYACGGWRKKNPLPSDRSRFGRFNELQDRNEKILREILEAAAKPDPKRSPSEQKIGDYFASCMDQAHVNQLAMSPIQAEIDKVAAVKSKSELGALIIKLHAKTVPAFFSFSSQQDFKDASIQIAEMDQGGMRLPSRDYYFDTDDKSKEIREKYVKHIQKMFTLSGLPAKQAANDANLVLQVETSLAKKALRPVERREPKNLYHMKSVAELQKMVPFLNWNEYMQAIGTPKVSKLNVTVVGFAQGLEHTIQTMSLDALKAYLRWTLLSDAAPMLSEIFEKENFDFFSRTLLGQKEMRPRWWRCTNAIDSQLGEALGQAYVAKAFSGDSKERMLGLIANLEKSLEKDITTDLPWMTETTKKAALVKLKAFERKIGYPDVWRDYSSVKIAREDLFGNAERASVFEARRVLAKIGQPVDKKEWGMTPSTVNAYYDPQNNNINFPAGILQPPFFNRAADDAVNYGAIGVVIGHEITHGFDDEGRQFDASGNLKDWWSKADSEAFNKHSQCFVDQYGSYVVASDPKTGDVKQDGKLTLGENAADNGGMRISWNALMDFAEGQKQKPVDGLSAQQRFFLSFAQVWCSNESVEAAVRQAKTNPHSASKYRTNGTVSNMPEFEKAFSCKPGQAMAPEKRCRVW